MIRSRPTILLDDVCLLKNFVLIVGTRNSEASGRWSVVHGRLSIRSDD